MCGVNVWRLSFIGEAPVEVSHAPQLGSALPPPTAAAPPSAVVTRGIAAIAANYEHPIADLTPTYFYTIHCNRYAQYLSMYIYNFRLHQVIRS